MFELIDSVRSKVIRNLPLNWKEQVGGGIYHNFQKMMVKHLKGEVRTYAYSKEKKIEYTIIDTGKPQKMIFLPGFADIKENFYNCALHLVKDYDLVIPDLPGFGRSFKSARETYDLKNYLKWMGAFIDHIGWGEFHLVSNSLGSAVAIEVALAFPDKIKSLTLSDCGGIVFRDQNSIYKEFINDRFIFNINSPLQFEYFLHRVFHKPPPIPPLVWNFIYREYARHGKWHRKVLNDLLEGIDDMNDPRLDEVVLNDRIKDLKVPTLILWGDEDSFFPVSAAGFMQSRISGSQLYIFDQVGHGPHAEVPKKFAKHVKRFISRL